MSASPPETTTSDGNGNHSNTTNTAEVGVSGTTQTSPPPPTAARRPLSAAAREVIREIVNTEEAYCKSLTTLRILFIEPMQRKFGKDIWNADVDTLFRIIDVLIQVNGVLLSQLRMISLNEEVILSSDSRSTSSASTTTAQPAQQGHHHTGSFSQSQPQQVGKIQAQQQQPRSIGKIFLELAPYLKSYTQYVNSYEGVFRTLEELRAKSPSLDKFITKAEESPDAENQKLLSFLIKPVQRIPRYNMLLNELRKHTPTDDPDYETLTTALGRIRAVADHVNQRLREDSSNNRCIEIDRIVHGLPRGTEIVHPSRKFVHEGRLLQIRRRSVRELYLFAFNDMILYCTPRGSSSSSSTRSDEYDCKGVVHLSESSWLNALPDNSMFSNMFQVVTKSKALTFSASSTEEKDHWIHDIEEQFTSLRANHGTPNSVGDRALLRWNPEDWIGDPPPSPLPATKQPPINGVELLQLVIEAGKESMFMGMALFGFTGSPVRFELTFDPGNMLEVFETVDDHWWIGRIISTGNSPQQFGLVPAHFFHCQAAEHMQKPRRRGSVSGMIVKRLSLKFGETDSDLSPQSSFTHGSPDRERLSSEFSPVSRAASMPNSASQPRDSSSSDNANKSFSPNPRRISLNIGSALRRLSLKANSSHSNLLEEGSLPQQPLVVNDLRRRTSAASDFFSKIGKKLPWGHKSRKSEGSFDSRAVPDSIVVNAASAAPEDGEFERFEKEFAEKLRKTGVYAESPTGQPSSNPEWNRTVDMVRTNATTTTTTRADSETSSFSASPTNPSPKARRKNLGIHRPSKSAPTE